MKYAPPSRLLTLLGRALLLAAAPLLAWVASGHSTIVTLAQGTFLTLHTVAEMFSVLVSVLIFVAGFRSLALQNGSGATNPPPQSGTAAGLWLGIVFLGVGLLDGLHALTFEGMPDALTPNTHQKQLIFWIAARFLMAIALFLYVLMPPGYELDRRHKSVALGAMLAFVAVLGGAGLLWPDRFPELFRPDHGRTFLKSLLESHVVVINLATLGVLAYRYHRERRHDIPTLAYALALFSVSELFVSLPGNSSDSMFWAHVYKVAAFMFLLRMVVNLSLRMPLEQLRIQHLREHASLAAAPDGVVWVDMQGRITMVNPAMVQLTGYAPAELLGRGLDILLPAPLRARHGELMQRYFRQPHGRPMSGMDIQLCRRDGQLLPVDISLGHWNDDEDIHAIAYIRDRSEHKKLVESLRHKATHDALTELPNRRLLQLELEQTLARASRSGSRTAVLFTDLDDFKGVNDTFGHATGDALLVQVGQRMKAVLRAGDLLARTGGDEFAVLVPDLRQEEEAVTVAVKLLACLQEPFEIGPHQMVASASIGIAFSPDDASVPDALMRYADIAMHRAKQLGRGTYACYAPDMDRNMHEDMQLHTRLKAALDKDLLTLHYQPQVDMRDSRIVGVEALLRWNDPVLGQVSPARFVPIAEATGLILPLSDWVLETACAQLAAWARAGTLVRLAINISAQQFHRGDLAAKVHAALQRHAVQARWLEIEITETMAMTQPAKAMAQLRALVELGCSVSLDDFGTGYSSLAYLKDLPISKIKIDRSFVQGLDGKINGDVIVQTIIGMARNLQLGIVAEGVETHAQREHLSRYGCHTAQGYLWHKPMPGQEFDELLRRHPSFGMAGTAPARQPRDGSQIDLL